MLEPNDPFHLEKPVWTDADFDAMTWHDVLIHGIGWKFDSESRSITLFVDIDYMFEWTKPEPPAICFSSWIAPCTLAFSNVSEAEISLSDFVDPLIWGLRRTEVPSSSQLKLWEYAIDMIFKKPITFKATGFTQYTRRKPIRHPGQRLSLEQRGGISFDRPLFIPD